MNMPSLLRTGFQKTRNDGRFLESRPDRGHRS
jgi:hypothetical protein